LVVVGIASAKKDDPRKMGERSQGPRMRRIEITITAVPDVGSLAARASLSIRVSEMQARVSPTGRGKSRRSFILNGVAILEPSSGRIVVFFSRCGVIPDHHSYWTRGVPAECQRLCSTTVA
jgi:hypothetical protein